MDSDELRGCTGSSESMLVTKRQSLISHSEATCFKVDKMRTVENMEERNIITVTVQIPVILKLTPCPLVLTSITMLYPGVLHFLLGNKGAHLVYGNIYTCTNCGINYKTQQGHANHTCLRCQHCGKIFPRKHRLDEHKCTAKNECELCKKTYKSKLILLKHKCSYCKICNKLFSTVQKKRAHKCLQSANITSTAVVALPNYQPISSNWQQQKCDLLGFQFSSTLDIIRMENNSPINSIQPRQTYHIKGDGNCFFRTVSVIITGSDLYHLQIRHSLVQHMYTIADVLQMYMNTPMSMANYVFATKMNENGAWATQVELFAAAHWLQTCVYLYTKVGNMWKWLQYSPTSVDRHITISNMSVYIHHINQNHFEPVVAMRQSSVHIPHAGADWYTRYLNNSKSHMKRKRESDDYRQQEQLNKQTEQYKEKQRNQKIERRKSENVKNKEKIHKQTDQYKEKHRIQKSEGRTSEYVKSKEKAHKMTQQYKEKHKIQKSERRKSEDVKNIEKAHKMTQQYKEKHKIKKSERRKSEDVKNKEKAHKMTQQYKEKHNIQKSERRRSEDVKNKEHTHKQTDQYKGKHRNKQSERRKSQHVKNKENIHKMTHQYKEKNRIQKSKRRMFEEVKNKEKAHKMTQQCKDKKNKQRSEKRKSQEMKNHEKDNKQLSLEKNLIRNFHLTAAKGPSFACCCCDQLFYRNNFVTLATLDISDTLANTLLLNDKKGEELVCSTCQTYIKNKKVPPLSKANGVKFPLRPEQLDLTKLEERLVAARTPFMQLRELPRGGQHCISGNVVNVPTNIINTIQVLPRKSSEEACIPIKLKRRLRYQHHYMYEYVRPNKVREAVKWLTKNSRLYKEEGIVEDEEWEMVEDNNDTEDHTEPDDIEGKEDSHDETHRQEDDFETDASDRVNSGPLDTLLQAQDIIEDARDVLSVAPSEGNFPVSIFMDKNSESLSFPSLFCGEQLKAPNEYNVKVHYSELCKSELRRTDRRVAGHISDIFFKLKKVQMKHILDKASICMRKTTGRNQNLTAGFLKNSANLEKLVHTDLGYKVFRDLKGSPPYWDKVKKDLFALIRFLGIPTWFCSFSSADTRWIHLLRILGKTVDNKEYTDEQIKNFSWYKKQELVKTDPVTCARQFDYQVRKLINEVIGNTANPIGEMVDYFYKVEFQQRGSPHIHMLVWVKDAPVYGETDEEDVLAFIQKYVSCEKTEDVELLIDLQHHSHSRTCRKNDKPICRFGYPIPPMQDTVILQPLDADTEDPKHDKKNWEKISKFLNNLQKEPDELNFNEFLDKLQITHDEYIKAVRTTISSPKVFLKRSLSEVRTNSFNGILLNSWRANMDIQFVLDAYSCAMYIVSYISKCQRGMSNLLYNAAKEAREGNSTIRDQVKSIGNKFLNNVEISAQEAVFTLLQLPLHKASRDVLFINTSPPEKRTTMLKDHRIIEALNDDSEDVFAEGLITHYSNRPTELQNMCLADYASWYRRKKKTTKKKKIPDIEPIEHNTDDDDSAAVEDESIVKVFNLKNGYQLVRRKTQLCIRYVRFNVEQDPENHFREILMLFNPWRDEQSLIGNSDTYQDEFKRLSSENDRIIPKMKEYRHKSKELEEAIERLEEINEDALEDGWDKVAPNTQHVEREDGALKAFLPGSSTDAEDTTEAVELNVGLGFAAASTGEKEDMVLNMMKDEDYHALVRSLNIKQREFFYFCLDKIKNYDEPFHVFLTGGAGVGKTAVTTAVYQMAIRYLNKEAGENPNDIKVLLGAPTGKAAFLINGNTLHHLFHIPASQGFHYKKLSNEKRNTLRCKYRHVRMLFIDECSMVGNEMFSFINLRLQEIIGNNKDFGGISVVAVGDFYQLQPVFDGWIFNNLKSEYGPLARNIWKDLFKVFVLDEIMRQKDDLEYAQLLNRLRVGLQTTEDLKKLEARVICSNCMDKNYPLKEPHIFMTNHLVDSHNALIYTLSSESEKGKFIAFDVVLGDRSDEVKEQILMKVPTKTSKTMNLAKTLEIAIGSRVELATNVDVADGLANGASGTVMAFQRTKQKNASVIVWVLFENERIGRNLRNESKHLYISKKPATWTPIADIKRQFPVGRYKNVEVMRRQLPLRPASAKTGHRCQGDTMDSAVVDFDGWTSSHAHYVALSRVKSLKSLYIRKFNKEKISVSQQVKDEMKRLLTEKLLHQSLSFPANISSSEDLTVMFQNIRSLPAHFQDIRNDPNFTSADINIFCETKLSQKHDSKNFELDGYTLHRNDCILKASHTSAYGVAFYHKVCEPIHIEDHRQVIDTVGVIESVTIHLLSSDVFLIGVYASPKVTQRAVNNYLLERLLTCECSVIVIGDFNVDLSKRRLPFQALKGMTQHIKSPTTDYNTVLDHIYSNITSVQTGVFESYHSDHKPVWIKIKK